MRRMKKKLGLPERDDEAGILLIRGLNGGSFGRRERRQEEEEKGRGGRTKMKKKRHRERKNEEEKRREKASGIATTNVFMSP